MPSNTDATGKVYPAGPLTPQLLALFKSAGLSGPWAAQWMNYRLKGSQVDFTDSAGRPLLLGNSVTEAGIDNLTVEELVCGPISQCLPDIAPAGGDGAVNVDDLLAVINAWGACADPDDCPADIAPAGPPVGDDQVNVDDLLAVINAWGACEQ